MRTIALVSQKGGVGKSTLSTCLAVAAVEAGEKVAALDLDPQGSVLAWGDDREIENLDVFEVTADQATSLPSTLKALADRGYSVAVLDCPGVASTIANAAMRAADFCLVPSRPTSPDLRATRTTIGSLVALGRPFAFILSQAPTTARSTRASEAAAGLAMMGVLAEPVIASRADYQDAFAVGMGVTEFAPQSKAAEEIRELWRWIDKRTKGTKP